MTRARHTTAYMHMNMDRCCVHFVSFLHPSVVREKCFGRIAVRYERRSTSQHKKKVVVASGTDFEYSQFSLKEEN
jgi:hypothetical protein